MLVLMSGLTTEPSPVLSLDHSRKFMIINLVSKAFPHEYLYHSPTPPHPRILLATPSGLAVFSSPPPSPLSFLSATHSHRIYIFLATHVDSGGPVSEF